MADAYTSTSAVSLDQAAYEQLAYFPLRAELYFDAVADVKPTNQSMRGSSVIFTIINDLAEATTPLSETVDVDAVAVSDSQATVTLDEYGNATLRTARLVGTSFIEVDPVIANVVGFNAGISQDSLARNALQIGTNIAYATGGATDPTSRLTVEADDKLTAHDIRVAVARLSGDNVPTFNGYYAGYIHSDVALDIREETGAASWRDPHVYSEPSKIWNGEMGEFEGVRFVKTPRAPKFADAGAGGTVDVYRSLFMGRQSLAKTWSNAVSGPQAQVVIGPIIDKLMRFKPVGWYWMGGYKIFRQAAIRAVESSSSIGANT